MRKPLFVAGSLFFAATLALAQPALRAPDVSEKASVGETVGITDVTISYHRPAVNARRIWGGLVPYNVVWRAGANESTTISFSTPVKVEGQLLPAGSYGLFMIPAQGQWTVVFSRFTGGWGAYSYDQSEDAARIMVTPQQAEMQERLFYTFDDTSATSAVASLRWEKLRIPFKIEVETPKLVMASMKDELRSGKHWNADAWAAAARYVARQGDLDTALTYASNSVDLGANVNNLRTKAFILEKKGDAPGAAALRAQAATLSPEADAMSQAYQMAGSKKYADAITRLNAWASSHPQSWRAYAALGEFYGRNGDPAKSKESFDKAMSLTSDMAQRVEVQDSINSLGADAK
jgi:TolA-binding protein